MNKLRSATYPTVAPSLLSMDKTKISSEVDLIRKSGMVFAHIDIMDGRFVDNKSFTLEETKEIIRHSQDLIKDVHIMVEEPWEAAKTYAELGGDIITFHYEACPSDEYIRKTIDVIRNAGCSVGIAISPGTPANVLDPYIEDIDLALVMSVWPGRGGQSFIESSLEKITYLRNKSENSTRKPIIEGDGGINGKMSKMVLAAGLELLVSGSYLFGHEDFVERAKGLLE